MPPVTKSIGISTPPPRLREEMISLRMSFATSFSPPSILHFIGRDEVPTGSKCSPHEHTVCKGWPAVLRLPELEEAWVVESMLSMTIKR
jgi:hypothetical protein